MSAAEVEQQVLAAGDGQPPVGLADPGHEAADDLKTLDGIGPVNEAWLHRLGVRCFWQIAAWSVQEVAWVAQNLPHFGSRVYRENWVAQAARRAQQSRSRL
jgi:NADH-quinone oxidoreductase subunit E